MKQYKHLTIEERETIQLMLWKKQSVRTIAKALNRSPSSISREVDRNKPSERRAYTPRLAQERAIINIQPQCGVFVKSHNDGILEQIAILKAVA